MFYDDDPIRHPEDFVKAEIAKVTLCLTNRVEIPQGSAGFVQRESWNKMRMMPGALSGIRFYWNRPGEQLPIRCFVRSHFVSISGEPASAPVSPIVKELEKVAKLLDGVPEPPEYTFKEAELMAVAEFEKIKGKYVVTVVSAKPGAEFEMGVLCRKGRTSGAEDLNDRLNQYFPAGYDDPKQAAAIAGVLGLKFSDKVSAVIMKIERVLDA